MTAMIRPRQPVAATRFGSSGEIAGAERLFAHRALFGCMIPFMKSTMIIVLALCVAAFACSGSTQTPEPSPPENTQGAEAPSAEQSSAEATSAEATSAEQSSADESSARMGIAGVPADDGAKSEWRVVDVAEFSKEEVLEQSKQLMMRFTEVLKSNAGDCDGMAAAVSQLADEAQPVRARAKELAEDPETKAWMDEKGQEMLEEMMPHMSEAMEAAQGCVEHEGMKKAMEKLQ